MASGRVRAKFNLAKDSRKSYEILKQQAEEAQRQNEKAADNSFWGRLTGGALGVGLGLLTGGSSLALTSALGGLGSYFGSKKGEANVGGLAGPVESGGFQLDKVGDINRELADYAEGVEEQRMMNAASDAFSIYMAGGGGMPGSGNVGQGTGAFSKMASTQASSLAAQSGNKMALNALMKAQAKQLVTGGAKNYLKKKGLDTAYEAYMNRNKS
tara:strand:+ start:21 stop:659 length:639 start_codon:yes stop_codon:yes gene_type:complete